MELPRGKNPPDGAILDFYFGRPPAGEVTLEILDSKNRLFGDSRLTIVRRARHRCSHRG